MALPCSLRLHLNKMKDFDTISIFKKKLKTYMSKTKYDLEASRQLLPKTFLYCELLFTMEDWMSTTGQCSDLKLQ